MTTITLHKYHEQINQLLNESQYDLAAEHCRHILQQQPQHIATYRLLAKTLLERGDYDGARELFQRILSTDPNDYIAHAGLAIIFKEEEVASQAIWHLERAYEIEPYNTAIQQELRALYANQMESQRKGQKNGDTAVIPTTLLLTKGALARLYLRSEMYDQATAVLRTALKADEERIDLRVLLMEALWRDGRRIEAVNVALQVLDQLPNCITANAILAEIWLRTGRVDEAQSYLQRLQSMLLLNAGDFDPEAPEGSAFRAEGAIPLPKVVELDYLGAEGAMAEFEESRTWGPGEPVEADRADAESDDMYQWLEGLTGDLPSGQMAEIPTEAYDEDLALSGVGQETAVTEHQSDWLAALTTQDEDKAVDEDEEIGLDFVAGGIQSAKESDDSFDYLFADDKSERELDWFSEAESETPALSAAQTGVSARTSDESPDEFAPDWLADLAEDDLEPLQIDSQTAAAWMREDNLATIEGESDETDEFDWLETPPNETPRTQIDSEAGELDLSQFADFQIDLEEIEEAEEFEWRLTDELSDLSRGIESSSEERQADTEDTLLEDEEFTLPDDLPADIPDWLMTGSQTGDLYEDTQPANDELAQELAGWVAANSPDLPEDNLELDWPLQEELEEDELDLWREEPDDKEQTAVSPAKEESSPLESGELPDWLSDDLVLDTVDSRLLGTDNLVGASMDAEEGADFADDLISDELPGWLQEETTAVDEEPVSTGDLPNWLMGASLDSMESAPLDEASVSKPAIAETEIDFPAESAEEPEVLETPMSDMLRAAAELDLSTEDELAAAEDLPGWLFADEDTVEASIAVSQDVEVEEVVSDEQDEKITGPEDEQDTQPDQMIPPDEELDWLDDLAALSGAEKDGIEALNDTGELPDWMQTDLDVAAGAGELSDVETAVSENDLNDDFEEDLDLSAATFSPAVPLEEEPDLNWLDALAAEEAKPEPIDELPTWQWPEDRPAPEELSDEAMETLLTSDLSDSEAEEPTGAETADFPDDLDDAMSWLEELAGEPDAPVEELPTVAQDLDLDLLFATEDTPEDLAESTPAADEFDLPPEDPEAAMAWLEQLAARQGAPLDELPSITTEDEVSAVEVNAVEAEEPLELASSERDEMDFAEVEATLFAADAEAGEETAVEADEALSLDVPDDPDEAMAWLEQLAARQGAPLDELPSIREESDAEEPDLDWAAADDVLEAETAAQPESEALDDLAEAMEWLDELEAEEVEPGEADTAVADWLSVEAPQPQRLPAVTPALLAELAWLEEEVSLDSGSTATDFDLAEIEVSDEELAAALDELDLLAGAPAAKTPEPKAETLPADLAELSDELDAHLAQAEELFDEIDTADATIVTATIIEETADMEDSLDLVTAGALTDETDLDLDAIPDDPDEAMAWLERLAARQGASLDELPSLYDADEETLAALTAVPEIDLPEETADEDVTAVSEMDVPDNIDDAMAWLEQLAARQGASLDELPSVTDTDGDFETPDWIAAAQAVGEAETEVEADDVWEEDAESHGPAGTELDVLPDAPGPESIAAAEFGVPDNIDDAMAWLEQLAARQGASLDELPSVTEGTAGNEDLIAPAWIEAARAAALAEESDTAPEEGLDTDEWVNVLFPEDEPEPEALPAEDLAEAEESAELSALEETDLDLGEVDDSLPDWLTTEGEDNYPRVVGHTDWLGSLPEPDLDGWLAAEEEATISGTGAFDVDQLPARSSGKTGPLSPSRQTGPLSERSLPETADLEDELLIPDLDLGLSAVELDTARLESARAALADGEIETALDDYAVLLETGEGLNTLISDLEVVTDRHTDQPLLRRMLGDAYMRNGQLQKALETYRLALDQM